MNPAKGKKYDPTTYTDFGGIKPPGQTAEEKATELDKKYREIVIRTIHSKIGEAKLEDIAHQIAINPRIAQHFSYLVKVGIDLETVFVEWYKAYLISLKRGNVFEGMEEGWMF